MENDVESINELIKTIKDSRNSNRIWLDTEEVLGPYRLEGGKLTEITQKIAYKVIIRSRKRQPGNTNSKENERN